MRPRDLLILTGVLTLGAAFGAVVLSTDASAVELPPGTASAVEVPIAPVAPVAPAVADGTGAAVEASMVKEERAPVDTSGWTTGTVMGDIGIAVSVLDRIQTISVVVEEMRNAIGIDNTFRHPHKYIVPVKMGIGTPTFEVTGIEFSEYPYCVSLYVPGLNGDQRTVVIDKTSPLHNGLRLDITPGSPFSVLLRDQDQNPYPQIDVRLVPVDAMGRAPHVGTTDSFGSVVFDSVLKGDYQIITGQQGMPLAEPETITVHPGTRMYGPKVQGQGHVVTVQRGMKKQFSVTTPTGYGVADAKIQLTASDRTRLTVLEAVTDFNGRAEFPHLTPGVWLMNVVKDHHEPRTKQFTIKDGELPPVEEIKLVRVR